PRGFERYRAARLGADGLSGREVRMAVPARARFGGLPLAAEASATVSAISAAAPFEATTTAPFSPETTLATALERTGRASLERTSFVDREIASANRMTMQRLHRLLGLFRSGHVDEGKAAGTSGELVEDEIDTRD